MSIHQGGEYLFETIKLVCFLHAMEWKQIVNVLFNMSGFKATVNVVLVQYTVYICSGIFEWSQSGLVLRKHKILLWQ